jgi:hypothetical protein
MSTRGLLVRFYGGMAIGIAAVVVVMGCVSAARKPVRAGGVLAAGQERGSWASPAELGWLRRVGIWETGLMRSLDRAAHVSSDVKAVQVAGPIQHCTDDLLRAVGVPPTARLRRALDTLERACVHLEDAVGSTSAETAESQGRRGGRLLLRADQVLPPDETRSLPVVAGAAVESHVDPKFSRIASKLAGKAVEARCWSRVDWTRLLREEKAYTMHHIDDDTLGFAGINGTRDNLSPEVCDSLGQLAYERWMPTAPSAKLLLAGAVVTLSHEPQHSKGIAVEAQAECYAIQLMKDTAVGLGATPEYAASLQRAYWQHYDQELPAYRSPACSNGSSYDLRKSDPSFP